MGAVAFCSSLLSACCRKVRVDCSSLGDRCRDPEAGRAGGPAVLWARGWAWQPQPLPRGPIPVPPLLSTYLILCVGKDASHGPLGGCFYSILDG